MIFKDEDLNVRVKCINFMTLFQDCIEQTNNDTFLSSLLLAFLDCKSKVD